MYQRFFLGTWNLGLEIWVFFWTTLSLNETSLRSRALSPREKQSPELPVIAKIWHQANLKQSPEVTVIAKIWHQANLKQSPSMEHF
jgi:hypothetical protein